MKADRLKRDGILIPLATTGLVIVLWQLVADFLVDNPNLLPSFLDVVRAFLVLLESGRLLGDFSVSLTHFGIGVGAALFIGIPLGTAMGWFREIDIAVNPIIEVLRPIPPLAWIPFAIIWFGLTSVSAGFIVFIGAFFPILINTYSGFRSVPRVFVEAARVLGCSTDTSLIRHVAFPSAIPSIATGVRVAMGVGWMCLVAAELFVGGRAGLGRQLWVSYSLQQIPNVVVYMLLLGLLGLGIDVVFRHLVDQRLLKWRKGEVM
ncbi:MAG: ABC transporter permease [Methanomicrobiaceae archaeon]|nr:ABC transporter permease [Methanomicrobiaceae archaeon]